MNEETELNEGDLVVPAPAEFSMYDFLEGVEYPEDELTVATNEKAAFKLRALSRDIQRYQADNDVHDEEVLAEYRKQLDEIREQIDRSKITFYLKGVPDEILTGAGDIAEAKFEEAKKSVRGADNIMRKVLPEHEKINYVRYLNAIVYSMHIYKIYYHGKGATTSATPDEIAAFMDKAPEAAKALLKQAINDLRVDAAEYEQNFDEGFFPKS